MKLKQVTLNGGAGMVVHALDIDQEMRPGDHNRRALCGKQPGGGRTRMGKERSRWRYPGSCSSDKAFINCSKCIKKLEALGIQPDDIPRTPEEQS